ncbi:RNA polymerase I-specific transcription initiation factor-domain-containing protein [Xylariaceae sp. FL0662B]|nr:RNA polymerase I-specific transcription initiation factor-domain-containing protein [Xylariaceae sp. FL0662B]
MALSENDADGDLSASEDSYEEERPNRWHGPKSTWQQLNGEEIDTFTALNEIRDRDLSIHLYNVFCLKRRHKESLNELNVPIPDRDVNAFTGQTVRQDDWLPHRSWTAWPMRVDKIPPPQDLMTRTDDPDERFTFRKATSNLPSAVLEEVISAAILRAAKEKFNARPWAEANASGADSDAEGSSEDSDIETVSASSSRRSRSRSVKYESEVEGEKMDVDKSEPEEDPYVPPEKRHLRPTVATDDEVSYALLRPSARHILAKLDTTLTILHNAQESARGDQSDSGDSEASESSRHHSRRSSRQGSQAPTKRRGRPPLHRNSSRSRVRESTAPPPPPPPPPPLPEEQPHPHPPKGRKKAGRPKKTYPRLDGESDRDFAVRVARLRKEPLPVFSEPERDSSDTAATTPQRRRRQQRPRTRTASTASPTPSFSSATTTTSAAGEGREARRPRTAPRTWHDVLGAAALAQFPGPALDRAARRCADLFGPPGMALRTLSETTTTATTFYTPGMPMPALLPEDNDEDEGGEDGGGREEGEEGEGEGEGEGAQVRVQVSGSHSRSRSASAVKTSSHACAFEGCPRAGDGFARRQNLLRHLKLVHGVVEGGDGAAAAVGVGVDDDVDSEDEMCGAVHVDGFLRPIRVRRGWRAADVDVGTGRRVGKGKRVRGWGRGRGGRKGGGDMDDEDAEGVGEVDY